MIITADLFEAHLKCPTKCWLLSRGEMGSGNTYTDWVRTQSESYRSDGINRLLDGLRQNECAIAPPEPVNLKMAKWRMAVDIFVQANNLESRLHVLEKVQLGDRGKPAQFIPFRILFRNKLTQDDKQHLAFDALVLSEMLGREIIFGQIIHGDNRVTLKMNTAVWMDKVRRRTGDIATLLSSHSPPDLILTRHCMECEFQTKCRREAMERDDLSLFSGMSQTERTRHRSKGIFTVNQLSYTFRPRKTPKRAKNPSKPHHFSLQALAIRENTVYFHGNPLLPESTNRVYLDIEGLPDRDFYYLIGSLVISNGQETFQSFWADTAGDQAAIFTQFAESITQLGDFQVFYFGDYDALAMTRAAKNLPNEFRQKLEAVIEKSVNVLSVVYPHIYFPTYSNSLKEIGRFIDTEPLASEATGLQSIVWRMDWEMERSAAIKANLLDYNKLDCRRLELLTEFIVGQTSSIQSDEQKGVNVQYTADMKKARPRWQMFARKEYALEDLKHVIKCGYFDYQRERVFFRTTHEFRVVNKNHRKVKRPKTRPSKFVDISADRCPSCKSRKLQTLNHDTRRTIDLKFSKIGVKRAVICVRCWHYSCLNCGKQFSSDKKFSTQQRYGHGLMSWCVYFNVVSGQNLLRVGKNLEDFFGIRLPQNQSYRFKRYLSAHYRQIYSELLQAILKSPVLHIDETTVNLRKQAGYVWTVTSMDMVYFFYRPSREGSFLIEMLASFTGVLISDFYTAYDSLPCKQQKCLVHLVREVDDDLIHNAYDSQFKELARDLGILLRRIVETVDRYGLKKRHLSKHNREVERFLKGVEAIEPASDLVDKYRQKFLKYGKKMFTFLDHDGVPWNNNNAEHAIKRFAKYRRNADGCYTERSLEEYLVLASVLETCEFNNINVLQFLLSKTNTLDGLFQMAGRKIKLSQSVPILAEAETALLSEDS
jgi:predicted RecB family nuclease